MKYEVEIIFGTDCSLMEKFGEINLCLRPEYQDKNSARFKSYY